MQCPLGPLVGTQRGSAATSSDAAAAAAGQPNSWANLADRLMGEARCHLKTDATRLSLAAVLIHITTSPASTLLSAQTQCIACQMLSVAWIQALDPCFRRIEFYGLFIHSFTSRFFSTLNTSLPAGFITESAALLEIGSCVPPPWAAKVVPACPPRRGATSSRRRRTLLLPLSLRRVFRAPPRTRCANTVCAPRPARSAL